MDKQEIDEISQDRTSFRIGWLGCQVTENYVELSTPAPEEFSRLRDAVLGFLKATGLTPLAAVGLNRHFHVAMESIDDINAIGDTLVPKSVWADVLSFPATKDVTLWGVRPDNLTGRVHVAVQPSNVVPMAFFVLVNDHFTLDEVAASPASRDGAWDVTETDLASSLEKYDFALDFLTRVWTPSLKRADAVLARVQSLAGAHAHD